MALPFLPGNIFSKNLGKDKFHKSHHFDCKNNVPFLFGQDKPGIGGEVLPFQVIPPPHSQFPRGEGSDQPSWVAFDRQVLSFDAYFQEAVHEKREESYRVRNVKIYFYLEDDSIQVIEPRMKNAGIPQGTLLNRHRVPRPPPHDDAYYRVEDFNVGKELNLYARVFKITGCDQFTHNFLKKLGVQMGNKDASPGDPYTRHRKAMDESMQPLRPYEKHDTLKQFLDHDRHVLRFYCQWDDSESMFGDNRDMVLHYFLSDDTLEIREILPANCGRDSAPLFLRRSKLPKIIEPLKLPGVQTDRTVLNVFGPMGHGSRYILDSLKTGAIYPEFYSDADLKIGNSLNVWGRKFTITDCDEFTREFYKSKYGIQSFQPVSSGGGAGAGTGKMVPPYHGFGSEEDSLASCIDLIPKPPRRDFVKFMLKDRHGFDSNVLRFLARVESKHKEDQDRRFIISYFLSDDTILVFEPPIRNSGIIGGTFLKRSRVMKPDQGRYRVEVSEYYTSGDLHVGAKIFVNCYNFILVDADEYCFNYMEQHYENFPAADINKVLRKLASKARENSQELREHMARNDPDQTGYMLYERFHSLANKLAGNSLTDHEIMTVARYYSDPDDKQPDIGAATQVLQDHLRKHNFTEFLQLQHYFLHYDQARCGVLNRDEVRRVLRAQSVPVPNDALNVILDSLTDSQANVNYDSLMIAMNWRDFPAPPVTSAAKLDEEWAGNKYNIQVKQVKYQDLINDLVGPAPTQ